MCSFLQQHPSFLSEVDLSDRFRAPPFTDFGGDISTFPLISIPFSEELSENLLFGRVPFMNRNLPTNMWEVCFPKGRPDSWIRFFFSGDHSLERFKSPFKVELREFSCCWDCFPSLNAARTRFCYPRDHSPSFSPRVGRLEDSPPVGLGSLFFARVGLPHSQSRVEDICLTGVPPFPKGKDDDGRR